jgi:hypothetical protein
MTGEDPVFLNIPVSSPAFPEKISMGTGAPAKPATGEIYLDLCILIRDIIRIPG